jgi:type IV pilus assembly protein PilY1
MKRMNQLLFALFVAILVVMARNPLSAQTMANYTAYPPFQNQTVPPLVMLVMDKDHRQFLRAYNDITDMDGDGVIDTTYKDTIAYDGYFDWLKCYTYVPANNRFEPAAWATGANGHYCTGQWSGNFLNWATMARIDVLRKVLYGGHRIVDTAATTVLSRTVLPQDSHSWAKAYTGADIGNLTPNAWASITFCNTNTLGTQTSSLVMIANGSYPYAASTENKQCVYQANTSSSSPYGPAYVPTYTYNTDVLVCVSGVLIEATCQTYTDASSVNHYKPVGLMQSMGLDRNGTATTADDVIHMKFALISGSYGAHTSGGVLRSNIVDMNSEIDPATGIFAGTSQIIANLERFKIVQYSYTSGWYMGANTAASNVAGDNCNQGEPLDLSTAASGYCRSWGNPMAEMMYEAIRYFKGLAGPTTQFQVGSPDSGLLGLTVAASWQDPYATCPYCSKPFMLLLSDPRPSYDSDELPGSAWPKAISTSDVPSVQTLMANANINALEGIGSVLIGQSGAVTDNNCTPKAGNFATIRGLCIEEPTKQGSYYMAGLANYAKTNDLRPALAIAQSITTYSVVTNPPFPTLTFQVGANQVQIIPSFHDGCPSTPWGNICGSQGANGDNSGGELVDFKLCPTDADWTTEQGNGFTSCYDLMWDDADYGWDYELDVRYRIYVKNTATQITVKTKGLYGAAGHTDYAGYYINGVTATGQYLDVVCGGSAGFSDCDLYSAVGTPVNGGNDDGMGNSVNTRIFTASGTITQVLKDPFWYASKYGGFKDQNGSKTPDLAQEWDQDGNGVPDTYFFTANPLQLQAQLGAAFVSILNSAGAGTAISVLANSASGDGALFQSFFFPSVLEPATLNEVDWVGYTQGLFVDTYGNVREDTDGDGRLIYQNDLIVRTFYDSAPASLTYGQTLANKFVDANGDGFADTPATPTQSNVPLTNVVPVWEAGKQLALMPAASRNIQTWVDSNNNGLVDAGEQIAFTTANDAVLSPYLRAGSTAPYTVADNIINFIRGTQVAGMRDRQRTVNGSLQVWKLGDNIYSTPTVVGTPKERFDILYGDSTYTAFYQKYLTTTPRRQVIYMGANDGMLHAINGGFYHAGDDPATAATTEHGYFTTMPTNNSGGPNLGDELWGFIPYQLLPQLKWLTQVGYTHVYYVDLKPKVTDVRIFTPDVDHPNGWGTILIGGFRMGGSCQACTAASGAPPMTVTDNFGSGIQTRNFYSAYFVLDITNPEAPPKLLWVFSDPTLGLTTGYPAVLRVNPPAPTLNTDNSNAKWFAVFGSGLTGYDGSIAQKANLWAIDLAAGPGVQAAGVYAGANKMPIVSQTTGAVSAFNSWMGDIISLDKDLDWRADAVYAGGTINDGVTPWRGKMYRLTIGGCAGSCTTSTWGIANGGGTRSPTEMLDTFPKPALPNKPGPITSAPTITLDDGGKVWLFFGTGRYYNQTDKTDMTVQYLFGVKDSVVGSSTPCAQIFAPGYTCWNNDLVDVSNATICVNCAAAATVTGVAGVSTGFSGSATTTLQGLVASKDGWFTTLLAPPLPPGTPQGERSISPPTLFGGTVFFPTFIPSTDVCIAAGTSNLYALFYLTGTAYTSPMIGSSASGANLNSNRSMSLGFGLSSATAIQTVSQGSGTPGAGGASGCAGRTQLYNQSSTGATGSNCASTALKNWSRYVSWINQRD